MPSLSSASTPQSTTQPAAIRVMLDRSQYQSCRIKVPDLDDALPAICVGTQFFSFLKNADNATKAFALVIKLSYRGEQVAIVPTAKGYALWGHEPSAVPVKAITNTTAPVGCCQILLSSDQFMPCTIQASDLAQSLVAIQYQGRYYSLFRQESDPDKLLSLMARLGQGGDDSVMTKTKSGWMCFVHEPSAVPVQT